MHRPPAGHLSSEELAVSATSDYADEVASLVAELRALGLSPILVGGMALALLGSQRVTRAFDFVIARPEQRLDALVDVLYSRGLELASRLNDAGAVVATIDSRRIAAIRLKIDAPSSAYFFNRSTGLRVDLLFDFPIRAAELASEATTIPIRSRVLQVASEKDLLRLKRLAKQRRSSPADVADIAFLEARRHSTRAKRTKGRASK